MTQRGLAARAVGKGKLQLPRAIHRADWKGKWQYTSPQLCWHWRLCSYKEQKPGCGDRLCSDRVQRQIGEAHATVRARILVLLLRSIGFPAANAQCDVCLQSSLCEKKKSSCASSIVRARMCRIRLCASRSSIMSLFSAWLHS